MMVGTKRKQADSGAVHQLKKRKEKGSHITFKPTF
jgi:hypothetical protein